MTNAQEERRGAIQRRHFLGMLSAGAMLALPQWLRNGSGLWVRQDHPLTPPQTEGPFYPVPGIEQQIFNDTELIRKLGDDEVAAGQPVIVDGVVMDQQGRPLDGSVVEIWQASSGGQYNHPQDSAKDPDLDRQFQFWGRALTGVDGRYEFHTIIPGQYPGREARHIHYRVDSPGFRRLTTQSYFAHFEDDNAQDGIYRSLNSAERRLVTVQFDKVQDQPSRGRFNIVMAASRG